jgi:hypothetical protein
VLLCRARQSPFAESDDPQRMHPAKFPATIGLHPGLALLVAIIALCIQHADSVEAHKDADHILEAISKQTLVLQDKMYVPRVERKRGAPTPKKTKKKPTFRHHKSERRKYVRRERHERLRTRRESFGRSRTH